MSASETPIDQAAWRDGLIHELLARFGVGASLRRFGPAAYDPASACAAVPVTTEVCTAVLLDRAAEDAGARCRLILSARGLAPPGPGDEIALGEGTYKVVSVAAPGPAGIALYYGIEARG